MHKICIIIFIIYFNLGLTPAIAVPGTEPRALHSTTVECMKGQEGKCNNCTVSTLHCPLNLLF